MLALKKITTRHLFLIIFIALLVTLPALFYGVFDAHDVKAHLLWSNNFARQFWQGELYPRWLLDSHGGLGSPSFFFYPPLPYYITSLFHPLFSEDSSGWLTLASSACFSLILSGIAAYFWLKEVTQKSAALIGAIAYMLLPYHLTVNLYLRFAYAEYWAFVWLPFILYFSIRYFQGNQQSLIGVILGYFFLSLTHLLTFVTFVFVPLFYGVLVVNRQQKFKIILPVLLSIFLGLGLSAIYWLPALTTQDSISTDFLWEKTGFLYNHNFLFALEPNDPRISFWNYLELMTLFLSAIAILSCFFLRDSENPKHKQELGYWLLISLGAIFMMTPFSPWVWERVTILQKIQFPWRFHSLLTLSISAVIALVFSSVKMEVLKVIRKPAIALILIFSIILNVWISYAMYLFREKEMNPQIFFFFSLSLLPICISIFIVKYWFKRYKTILAIAIVSLAIAVCLNGGWAIQNKFKFGLVFDDNINQPERLTEILEFRRDPPEYRPKWFKNEIWWSDKEMTKLAREIDRAQIMFGRGNISVEQWKPRNIILQVNSQTGLFIKVSQLYYRGWNAKFFGSDRALSVYPDGGLVGIFIPQGQHKIRVQLEAGRTEKLGGTISAVSALLTWGLFRWFQRKKILTKRKIYAK